MTQTTAQITAAARRAQYLQLRESGLNRADAAARVGAHLITARDWDQGIQRMHGGRLYPDGRFVHYATGRIIMVDMSVPNPRPDLSALEPRLHPRYLTLEDREMIADLHQEGTSIRAIARALVRPASTIKRELDAHRAPNGRYRANQAHRAAAATRARPKPAKLATAGPLRDYVVEKLGLQWSPEQIHNDLRIQFPTDESMRVSAETIYQAVYIQARGGLRREVAQALRSGRTRRKPHRDLEHRRSRYADDYLTISDRPAEVEDRAVPGDWEGDLIMGANQKSAIGTLVERHTRFALLVHLPGGVYDAITVRDALINAMLTMPKQLRRSLTWDQGTEMAKHKSFTLATNMPVYFCDPHSPWQRGSNENTNGLLRQYFPKGTDLSVHSPEVLEEVAWRLNTRPRKTLGWDTPAQRLRALLDQ